MEPPKYAHVPMILGDDGKRLSKRHGAVSVMQYRNEGFLPEAVLNYLVRLGWSYQDQEIFSIDEMIEYFDVKDVNRASSTFNTEKLLWVNQHYIKESPPEHIAHHLSWHVGNLDIDPTQGPELIEVVKLHQERAKTLKEMSEDIAFYYKDFSEYEEKAAKKNLNQDAITPLQKLSERFSTVDWTPEAIHTVVQQVAEELELKMGKVAQPLRVAISGRGNTPPIDTTVYTLGREKTLARIQQALDYIQA